MYKLAIIITLLSLASCTSLYYGHTKEEWASMSDLEKDREKAKYEEIIKAKQGQVQRGARDRATDEFTARAVKKTGN